MGINEGGIIMKTLLTFAFYEDFEERSTIGIVKDKSKITALIKNDFEEVLNKTAQSDNYIQPGIQYETKIDISFDMKKNVYHARGVITDIEMKKQFEKLPEDMKTDFNHSLMAPEFELDGFYRLDEVEEI